ncbi:S8 family peptidase [Syntrophomonas wolfei]|uniref:Subtilisin-like serine protease n=1 Tax=Syntrophomonas wolfei subsp. wolfei (strain DSM 2245B / Goettingen) TaxID=335541 RepID=Q0AUR0_SYNWW|nr:S8 family peptidase [Syntrophomonas wolfei]ABI69544.1 subtilisin-like serine protease [Syntrophomonas wolfei subsp. wolfei str. Goettingen G311]
MPVEKYRHIFLENGPEAQGFTTPPKVVNKDPSLKKDADTHSADLTRQFGEAWRQAEGEQANIHRDRNGIYIEFKSDPGAELVTKSLEDLRSKKVRLLNVREDLEDDQKVTYATVYVSHDKQNHFLDKIEAYAKESKHIDLINSIAEIRKALLIQSFWTDSPELVPKDSKEWCEVWLSSDNPDILAEFEHILTEVNIKSATGFIRFPERMVKLILANRQDLELLTREYDYIAEYRRAKETASFWVSMPKREQADWLRDLQRRLEVVDDAGLSVCILDTGINNGHPLLSPVLRDEDCLTVEPHWGEDDHDGHGTLMGGIVTFGNLEECLVSEQTIKIPHRLESVKILPRPPHTNSPELWGHITAQAVSKAEIQAPHRIRICCLAIAATDTRDRGRPSSWSGQIDNLASGAHEEDNVKRLFIVCVGNITDLQLALDYPNAQLTDSVHDPAQSWNTLTVGAFTELDDIIDPTLEDYLPVARSGQLSPFTTTSITWDNKWPNKPDIVMEGGNLSHDGQGNYDESYDLSLLSTFYDPTRTYFAFHNMTSAATAKAAWLAAQIYSLYPHSWPETVRALMVHSAEWTDQLKLQFLLDETKGSYAKLLRICGYGIPNLDRALYSASNSLTLISEAEIQPYEKKDDNSGYRTKEMHLYDLPWPKEALESLPDNTEVRMRVTLSYFVEPGPGEIGWKDRYRYASYGLRFDVKSPTEDIDQFIRRINAAVRTEEAGHPGTQSAAEHWLIGSTGRDKGSIHSDIWQGTARELAESGVIAIFPIIGWWRERAHLGRVSKRARYSLIVSITTSAEDVDIYTPVANMVGITIPVTVEAF